MLVHAEHIISRLLGELVAMGIFCAVGTLCFYTAVKHTSASNVSQYHYTQLLTGALISYVLWHELPTLWMLAGAALIVGSGAYIAFAAARSAAACSRAPARPVVPLGGLGEAAGVAGAAGALSGTATASLRSTEPKPVTSNEVAR